MQDADIHPPLTPGAGATSTGAAPSVAAPSARPPEPTVAMPAQGGAAAQPAPPDDVVLADPARRRQVEAELARLGMSPQEIHRFLTTNAHSSDVVSPPPAARPSAGSVAGFAAELNTAAAAARVEAIRKLDLGLPEFRTATPQETIKAEQLLREANALRRRERYRDAEAKCREALTFTPKDAAALELLGDILQGVARVDEALAAYLRATEADAKRSSAERKYGDLLMRQEQWNVPDAEAVPNNPFIAVLLSALAPGGGQVMNGDYSKAAFFFIADIVVAYLLLKSPWGFAGERRHHGINGTLMGVTVVAAALYIIGLIDANVTARAGGAARTRGSGWDV